MTTTGKSMKRIHKVTIKRMIDESPADTSWLGEYTGDATSNFSIDRAHDLDCPQQTYNTPTAELEQLECAIAYLNSQTYAPIPDAQAEAIQDAQNLLIEAQTSIEDDCNCNQGGNWNNREYRYFNPSFNYVDKNGNALPKNTPEDVRKYVAQDYARMERGNAGDWCLIGIRAEAEYSVGTSRNGYLAQEITSGGLWGIESDSEESYLKSVEDEELIDLSVQLKGIGFSGRAIAAAFKNVEREGC